MRTRSKPIHPSVQLLMTWKKVSGLKDLATVLKIPYQTVLNWANAGVDEHGRWQVVPGLVDTARREGLSEQEIWSSMLEPVDSSEIRLS